ncbi:MucR family transcriptional regulator [Sphingomonas sp. AP4-R1]|uniref:MucR family transcriptional regulator n=1 Tax=Sphingomonas sp. AP4-R1 TaxID=2735134 RepID=UPI001493CC0A|nr:MucR family transcriptional regulator [Sphingomonas sp. AP4-R1]QJU59354.1 MucR family transcriptional regulator [Sphingomonas sp. AP4-R1]
MAEADHDFDLITLTADIVAAHVTNNSVHIAEVPKLIGAVYEALAGLGQTPEVENSQKPKGAVSVRASVKPGHLISMIDGKPYKMLRRHLGLHGHTPESYRETFNLPRDYPMVAADYAEKRRSLALKIGLGRKPESAKEPVKRSRTQKPVTDALGAAKQHLGG